MYENQEALILAELQGCKWLSTHDTVHERWLNELIQNRTKRGGGEVSLHTQKNK
jgi:hypothetical protein